MPLEPRTERELLGRTASRSRRICWQLVQDSLDGGGYGLGRRWLEPVLACVVRNTDATHVSDQLNRAAARRMHDGELAGHRLEHDARARVVHLRV